MMRNLQSALKAFRSRKRFQAEGIIRNINPAYS